MESPVPNPIKMREYRKSLGYSQAAFGKAHDLSLAQVIKYEGGVHEKSRFQAWQEMMVGAIATLRRKNHQMLAA
jgi:DNA-binding XRE family transcriptional regulator